MATLFGKAPPAYRSLVKVLHWVTLVLVIAVMAAGNTPLTKWGLLVTMTVWVAGFVAYGILARPGPALSGVFKTAFVPAHWGMMILPALLTIALLRADPGPVTDSTRSLALATIAAGSLHGVFHLWRHTALRDGALRNMTPKFMHGML